MINITIIDYDNEFIKFKTSVGVITLELYWKFVNYSTIRNMDALHMLLVYLEAYEDDRDDHYWDYLGYDE